MGWLKVVGWFVAPRSSRSRHQFKVRHAVCYHITSSTNSLDEIIILIMKKAIAVFIVYFCLLLLRKTIFSFDVRILHWFLNEIELSSYEGHVQGFLNLGEIQYNLTQMKLSGLNIEHSNIDTSPLWKFPHNDLRYLNIIWQNGKAKFYANWAYSMWPSLTDNGTLVLQINNASLQFGVDISTSKLGFVNFTLSDCTVKQARLNLELYHEPNIMYDSMKPSLQKKAEDGLPKGLCKALHRGVLKRINSSIQNVQQKFVNFILFGDVRNHQNLTSALGWTLVYTFIIAVKLVHDYGVTASLVFATVALYSFYELMNLLILKCSSKLFKHPKTKVRSLSDPERRLEQEIPVLTPVSVTVVSTGKEKHRKAFLRKFKNLLWWRKRKEN